MNAQVTRPKNFSSDKIFSMSIHNLLIMASRTWRRVDQKRDRNRAAVWAVVRFLRHTDFCIIAYAIAAICLDACFISYLRLHLLIPPHGEQMMRVFVLLVVFCAITLFPRFDAIRAVQHISVSTITGVEHTIGNA